jgi:hypothetical protein
MAPWKWVIILSTDRGHSAGYFQIRVTGPAVIGKKSPVVISLCWKMPGILPEITVPGPGERKWWYQGKCPGFLLVPGPVLFSRGYLSVFLRFCDTVNPDVSTVNLHIRVLYVFFVYFGQLTLHVWKKACFWNRESVSVFHFLWSLLCGTGKPIIVCTERLLKSLLRYADLRTSQNVYSAQTFIYLR